jgi:hypothetical protein
VVGGKGGRRVRRRTAGAAVTTLAVLFAVVPRASYGADLTTVPADRDSENALGQKALDPTANLTQLQFKDEYTPAEYGTKAQTNTFLVRPILAIRPHGPLHLDQLVRPTFSIVTVPEGAGAATVTALDDTQLFDLLVPWPDERDTDFRWGIGPYFIFPTATNEHAGKGAWQIGPAAAFRYRGVPHLLVGLLLQQATSFAYTSPSRASITSLTVQPTITYQIASGWYLESSDATWTFDLRHNTPTEIPLSAASARSGSSPTTRRSTPRCQASGWCIASSLGKPSSFG